MSPNDQAQPLIRARDVEKRFGENHVLKGIDLDLHQGEVISLLGPSGSGKSTFLRCVNMLETLDSGAVHYRDELLGFRLREDVYHPLPEKLRAKQREHFGMVFQQFNLFPHMTVIENICEGLRVVHRRPKAEALERGRCLLERVGLSEKENEYPGMLSGGQQQRVAIARALAPHPSVMLFDEPTSALDPELVGEVLDVIRELASSGMTMLIVTHELNFAREVSNRVALLDGGRIVEFGAPDDVLTNPQSTRARAFVNAMKRK
ncbi:amino acid ABC transporter ATP-binding protein [Microbacterium sp. KUDC0406]|uniref:amino acid ABC transporter ATP-binding protein n=1 Tax=Microbacterium sp. KUDC0406 TaxID=2909588 RepID=UPI001F212200|nr:amino acid ABC transporter ATP-binding protein [Microbacterium sp. KUDC0406]UJP09381.1 amino acid ABC transporter ATP-binding protein [Microbacterium sp. KUDC0406]